MAYTFFLVNVIALNFPATEVIERYGLEKPFKIASLGSVIGAWLRWYLMYQTDDFSLILVGTGVVAVFQPFIYVGVSKVATRWFSDKERATATTIMSLADPIGCIIGMVLGPIYVLDSDKEDPELGKQHVNDLLMVQAIACTILYAPLLLFFKERPEHYPSNAAREQ